MGPTSSGKTTLSEAFTERMRKNGKAILHYDGDEVRDFFGSEHGFSKSSRQRVVSTLIHLARKGSIDTLVGFNTTYRPPDSPDIVLNTEINTVNELADS